MHRLIRLLVFAQDRDSALDTAIKVVHNRIKDTSEERFFDYDESLVWGRWEPILHPLQVSTTRFPTEDRRGMLQVRDAFELIRNEFKVNITGIRHHLANYTDEELHNEVTGNGQIEIDGIRFYDDPKMFKYYCRRVGLDTEDGYLFDSGGYCINHIGDLQKIITDSDENPCFFDYSEGENPNWGRHIWNQPLWVVPFDVFFDD
jgi:hypothetical protein